MATVNYSVIDHGPGYEVVKWENIAAGDTCQAYVPDGFLSDRSVQITGTLTSTSSTLAIQGSNFGIGETSPTFLNLSDPLGVALSFTATQTVVHQLLQNTRQIRPSLTGGSATAITIRLYVSAQR